MPSKLIGIRAVLEKTSYRSPTTIWNLEKKNLFPKRRRIGPGRVAWLESEVEAWIESRAAGIAAKVERA